MFTTSAGHQAIAEAIQQMWATTLGVNAQLTNQEFAVFLDTILDPVATPQVYRLGWCVDYPDANNFTPEMFAACPSQNPKHPPPLRGDGTKRLHDLGSQQVVLARIWGEGSRPPPREPCLSRLRRGALIRRAKGRSRVGSPVPGGGCNGPIHHPAAALARRCPVC